MTRTELHRRLQMLKVLRDCGEIEAVEYGILRQGAQVAYQEKQQARKAARRRVRTALKRGELERPSRGSACGTAGSIIQGHHEDYSRPLAVTWLCDACHDEAEQELIGRLNDARN